VEDFIVQYDQMSLLHESLSHNIWDGGLELLIMYNCWGLETESVIYPIAVFIWLAPCVSCERSETAFSGRKTHDVESTSESPTENTTYF